MAAVSQGGISPHDNTSSLTSPDVSTEPGLMAKGLFSPSIV